MIVMRSRRYYWLLLRSVVIAALLLLSCGALSSPPDQQSPILVVGATGSMGPRAITGLMDVGYAPGQLRILTRRADKAADLQKLGFGTAVADLEVPDGTALADAVTGCVGCYIHSTSSDTMKLDTAEVDQAQNLCKALRQHNVLNVVFNSAAGETKHGVKRIQQKHDVEGVFTAHADMTFTSLRANLFMEELWKGYTRPSILKGNFPFSVPSDRPIYLTSVRDMGRLAGTLLQQTTTTTQRTNQHRILNVAGDVLKAKEMADAFARAQGSPCQHSQNRLFALLVRFFVRDLYEVIRFYRQSTETTDINALQQEFPGLLTSFASFLQETNWSNPDLSFEDLQNLPVEYQASTST